MSDLIKVFYDIGVAFDKEFSLNQISTKKVDKILCYGVEDASLTLWDSSTIKEKLFLRVLSANGGNLYPIFFLKKKKNGQEAELEKPLQQSKKNMDKYIDKSEKAKLEEFWKKINLDFLQEQTLPFLSEENCYFAVFDKNPQNVGKSIYEIFPSVAENYGQNSIKNTGKIKKGTCYLLGDEEIGYDASLPFASVNEMPKTLASNTKFRLLPLSKRATKFITKGFEKVFKDNVNKSFKFNIFGENYVLLPSVFTEDKKQIFNLITKAANTQFENKDIGLHSKNNLEKKLDRLIKNISEKQLGDTVFFTFLFYRQNNNEIILFQAIEDVAPSKISKASKLIKDMNIECYYLKQSDRDETSLQIRDYIDNGITLAKLLFGKEKIDNKRQLYSIIFNKIMFGSNKKEKNKRYLSKIISGYYKDDVDFCKHQKFIDFLSEIGALNNTLQNIQVGGVMDYSTLEQMFNDKFSSVELLSDMKAQEFYTVGAFARFVIDWQYNKNSETVAKYLDSIGTVSINNIDRVFRKIYNGSRKFKMYGEKYDFLLSKYSEIKAQAKATDKISTDIANIAFVMGSVDYKQFSKNLTDKEENND